MLATRLLVLTAQAFGMRDDGCGGLTNVARVSFQEAAQGWQSQAKDDVEDDVSGSDEPSQ